MTLAVFFYSIYIGLTIIIPIIVYRKLDSYGEDHIVVQWALGALAVSAFCLFMLLMFGLVTGLWQVATYTAEYIYQLM